MANEFQIKHGLIVSGSAEIEQDLRVRGTLTVDELHTSTTTSSVLYESGSTRFGDSSDDIHEFTGSVNITGSISLNGEPIGTGKLNETTFQSYTSSNDDRVTSLETSSGSLNSFTSSINTTIKSKLDNDNVISGSVQVDITSTTGYSTFSSSVATTDLNQTNRLISIETKTGSYATTGSNLFIGTQTHSGSIIPSVDNEYDLGSVTHQWRDVYISSGSLYIDGTKVISSTAQELQITTDNGQSIKILEGGTDSIILQTADGNVELKSNADGDILLDPTNGKILLKGPVEILSGQKIQSSVGGTPVVFANDIVVSGSIDITGTIEGINLTDFSSSINTRVSNLESGAGSLNAFTASATTRLNSLETTTGSLNTYTSSNNTRLGVIEVTTGSLNSYTSSNNDRLSTIESTTSSLNTYTSSNNETNATQNDRLTSLETTTGSLNTYTSSNNTRLGIIETSTSSLNSFTSSIDTTIKNKLNSEGVISGSLQVTITGTTGYSTFSSSVATTDLNQTNRLISIETKTGSYATTGSNLFIGNQTITGSLYVSQNLIVQGESSLENITASAVSIGTNTIILNTDTPALRYAGISVFDSGSTNVTSSLFYDSLTNQWKFKHDDVGTSDASIMLFGPLGGDIDNTPLLVSNYLTKVEGTNNHGHHITTSSIFDDGSKVSINSNTEITGTFVATGTALVSGSSQISHDSTTGYVANRHIDHSAVTITAGNGLSGGGDITSTRTITLDTSSATFTTGVKSKMNTDGVISGSSQVVAALPSGTVSGSSQVLSGTGIWSGSAQLPSGVVSGSSQVLAGTTIHSGSFFNGISVVSGSGQISFNGITDKPALVSGSSQISFNTISDKPALVSGSSQIIFGSISSIPGGLVSGSSQIDLTATTNYSTGIKTRLNAEGVISGSSQVTNIGNPQLVNSSFHVGTTSISLGRASAAQTLTGVSIDGNATSETLATVTGRGATTSTAVTFTGTLTVNTNANQVALFQSPNANTWVDLISTTGTWSMGATSNNTWDIYQRGGVNQTRFSVGASSASLYGNIVLHAGNFGSYALPLGGGTMTGIITTVSNGTAINFSGQSDSFGYNTTSGQGTYIKGTSSTYVYGGGTFFDGSTVRTLLHSGNFTSYAMSGAGYSANQNLSTSSTVQFGSLGVGVSPAILAHFRGAGEMVRFENTSAGNNEYTQLNFRAGTRNGYIWLGNQNSTSWAGDGGLNIYTDFGNMDFWTNNIQRVRVQSDGHMVPFANNTYDLGSSSLGWRNVYTNDLHLSNMNKPEGNDIDGTNGNWTIQEGAENLYIINNNNGKKFKIKLEEV